MCLSHQNIWLMTFWAALPRTQSCLHLTGHPTLQRSLGMWYFSGTQCLQNRTARRKGQVEFGGQLVFSETRDSSIQEWPVFRPAMPTTQIKKKQHDLASKRSLMIFERASTGLAVGGYKTSDKGQTMKDRCGRCRTQTSLQRCWRKEKRGERDSGNVHTVSNLYCDCILSSPN